MGAPGVMAEGHYPLGCALGPAMQRMEHLANFELLQPDLDFIKSCKARRIDIGGSFCPIRVLIRSLSVHMMCP